jgi:hypothetical protein
MIEPPEESARRHQPQRGRHVLAIAGPFRIDSEQRRALGALPLPALVGRAWEWGSCD